METPEGTRGNMRLRSASGPRHSAEGRSRRTDRSEVAKVGVVDQPEAVHVRDNCAEGAITRHGKRPTRAWWQDTGRGQGAQMAEAKMYGRAGFNMGDASDILSTGNIGAQISGVRNLRPGGKVLRSLPDAGSANGRPRLGRAESEPRLAMGRRVARSVRHGRTRWPVRHAREWRPQPSVSSSKFSPRRGQDPGSSTPYNGSEAQSWRVGPSTCRGISRDLGLVCDPPQHVASTKPRRWRSRRSR